MVGLIRGARVLHHCASPHAIAQEAADFGYSNALADISKRLTMANLNVTEIKAFVPAKDFALSQRFYQDLGFTMASEGGGVAYFHYGDAAFLLQDCYHPDLAGNLTMHLLVEDVDAWHAAVLEKGIAEKYGVKVGEVQLQPWRMRDFAVVDPSGVCWQVAENVNT